MIAGDLAARTAAKKPSAPVTPVPSERTLITKIQANLTKLGFDPGPADGAMGWKTRSAIRSYQQQNNLTVSGEPTAGLLARL